jgi:hypothetical protein
MRRLGHSFPVGCVGVQRPAPWPRFTRATRQHPRRTGAIDYYLQLETPIFMLAKGIVGLSNALNLGALPNGPRQPHVSECGRRCRTFVVQRNGSHSILQILLVGSWNCTID